MALKNHDPIWATGMMIRKAFKVVYRITQDCSKGMSRRMLIRTEMTAVRLHRALLVLNQLSKTLRLSLWKTKEIRTAIIREAAILMISTKNYDGQFTYICWLSWVFVSVLIWSFENCRTDASAASIPSTYLPVMVAQHQVTGRSILVLW